MDTKTQGAANAASTNDRCDCGDYPLDEVPPAHRCEEDDEPELTTAEEIGAGSYLGWGNGVPW